LGRSRLLSNRPGAFSLEVKWSGLEADDSPPTRAKVKKTMIYTSIPHSSSWHSAQGQLSCHEISLPLALVQYEKPEQCSQCSDPMGLKARSQFMEEENFSLPHSFQTGSGTHPVSHTQLFPPRVNQQNYASTIPLPQPFSWQGAYLSTEKTTCTSCSLNPLFFLTDMSCHRQLHGLLHGAIDTYEDWKSFYEIVIYCVPKDVERFSKCTVVTVMTGSHLLFVSFTNYYKYFKQESLKNWNTLS
jgi:hypothetical protein